MMGRKMSLEIGDIISVPYSTYVLVQPYSNGYWTIFYLDSQEFSALSDWIIELDIRESHRLSVEQTYAGG